MEFLGDEWLADLGGCGFHAGEAAGTLDVKVDVAGGPGGTRTWSASFVDGRLAKCAAGSPPAPAVTLTVKWPDAVAIARGEVSANAAFMRGDIKTEGPTGPLLAILRALGAPTVVASVEERAGRTTF